MHGLIATSVSCALVVISSGEEQLGAVENLVFMGPLALPLIPGCLNYLWHKRVSRKVHLPFLPVVAPFFSTPLEMGTLAHMHSQAVKFSVKYKCLFTFKQRWGGDCLHNSWRMEREWFIVDSCKDEIGRGVDELSTQSCLPTLSTVEVWLLSHWGEPIVRQITGRHLIEILWNKEPQISLG